LYRMRGRPTKKSPEVIAKLVRAIALGLTDAEAALLAGINDFTLSRWRRDKEFQAELAAATAERKMERFAKWTRRIVSFNYSTLRSVVGK
jgi:hypothetical protein